MMEEAPSINFAILSFRFGIIEHNLKQPWTNILGTAERCGQKRAVASTAVMVHCNPLLAIWLVGELGAWSFGRLGIGRWGISNISGDHLLGTDSGGSTLLIQSISRSIVVYTAINFNEFLFTCETICNCRYDLTGSRLRCCGSGCHACDPEEYVLIVIMVGPYSDQD